jgi:hypothetical protein
MCALQAERLWQEAFPDKPRPQLYASDKYDEDGFKPLADPQEFLTNIANLTHLQLYALADNNVLNLKAAQDEYQQLTREIATIKGRAVTIKHPRALDEPEVFEHKKQSALYGYEYVPPKPAVMGHNQKLEDFSEQEKRDVIIQPDPFTEAKFVPTPSEFRRITRAAKKAANPDGWKPIEIDGKWWIPLQQTHHDEYRGVYRKREVDANGEIIRPVSPDPAEVGPNGTPIQLELVDKRITRTRFGGKKHPPTRDASEAPSTSSTPSRKRAASPATVEPREGTPKRQKPNGIPYPAPVPLPIPAQPAQPVLPVKPKHPNQYTKAREREQAAQLAAARAAAGGGPVVLPPTTLPDISSLSTEEKLNRKWTDDELRAAITADHTWLNPDPAKAAEWRDKILQGVNPVRSWSMVKKWSQWKGEGKDKRPRKKLVDGLNGVPGSGDVSGSNTPAPMPVTEPKLEADTRTPERTILGGPVRGNGVMGVAALLDGGSEGIKTRRSSEGTVTAVSKEESRSRSGTPGGRPTPTRRSTRNR